MITRLSYEAVVLINEQITGDCVIRDPNGLDSALHRPFHTLFGDDAFDTLIEKAAVLLHGLATAHAFKDGNKRTAWTACQSFLGLNGVELADDGAAGPMVLDLVEGRMDHPSAALWLADRIL